MSFVYILKNYLCLTTHPPFLPFFLSSHLCAMHIKLMGLSKLNTERIWKKKTPMYFFEKKNEKMKKRTKQIYQPPDPTNMLLSLCVIPLKAKRPRDRDRHEKNPRAHPSIHPPAEPNLLNAK